MYTDLLKNLTNAEVITICDSNEGKDALEQIGKNIGATGDFDKIELLRSLIIHRIENKMSSNIFSDIKLYTLVNNLECTKQQVIEFLELLTKLKLALYSGDTAAILERPLRDYSAKPSLQS